MSLIKISSKEALKNIKSKYSIWPKRGKSNRINSLPLPKITPSFKFSNGDKFFCLGSCFAQEIGYILGRHGFNVISNKPNPYMKGLWGGANHLIRYNVYSILNEINWALNDSTSFNPSNMFLND